MLSAANILTAKEAERPGLQLARYAASARYCTACVRQTSVEWLCVVRPRHARLWTSDDIAFKHDIIVFYGSYVPRSLTVTPHGWRCTMTPTHTRQLHDCAFSPTLRDT